MSAPFWFMAGLLAGAAAMLGAVLMRSASRGALHRGRRLLLAGGITVAAAVALTAGMSLAVSSRQGTTIASGEPFTVDPQRASSAPSSAMPPASMMAQILSMPRGARARPAEPMDQAAANLAARLERQGGTAADWNLLAQAYDFLGRPADARRARARAAQAGTIQRIP